MTETKNMFGKVLIAIVVIAIAVAILKATGIPCVQWTWASVRFCIPLLWCILASVVMTVLVNLFESR